uniref:PqqD family protein n=1 Tax=Fervidicoccus fontis TaxID=683846 RepID=A0A7J3ZKJ7_9CREN
MEYDEIKDKVYVKRGQSIGSTGESFVVAVDEESLYELSPAAYYVWEQMNGERTVAQIVEKISSELNIDYEELKQPVALVIEKLLEVGLLAEQYSNY